MGRKTYAGRRNLQHLGHKYAGKQCLDIHLLKAGAHEAVTDVNPAAGPGPARESDADHTQRVQYSFRTAHPILRWLPSKLAEYIADNHGKALNIPAKLGAQWSVGELNNILHQNLVPCGGNGGHLRTFGMIEWECELYKGRTRARCYPFDLDGHRFRGKTVQVCHGSMMQYMIYYAISYMI